MTRTAGERQAAHHSRAAAPRVVPAASQSAGHVCIGRSWSGRRRCVVGSRRPSWAGDREPGAVAGARGGGAGRASRRRVAALRAARGFGSTRPARVCEDQVLALAAVAAGDRLLSIDADGVAARVARSPVGRGRARAARAAVGAGDRRRRAQRRRRRRCWAVSTSSTKTADPFKRAALDEADGLVRLTGVSRQQYAGVPGRERRRLPRGAGNPLSNGRQIAGRGLGANSVAPGAVRDPHRSALRLLAHSL